MGWDAPRRIILLCTILSLLFSTPAFAKRELASSHPYSLQQFQSDLALNPLEAAKSALMTGNRHYIHTINFSTIPPHIADHILDQSLNPDFPATKIAEAINAGVILKRTTWKRLTQTQLAHRVDGKLAIRDFSPDLSVLNPAERDRSVRDNAGMALFEQLNLEPYPESTSTSDTTTVAITGLATMHLSTSLWKLTALDAAAASFSAGAFSTESASTLHVQLPAQTFREPLFPSAGTPVQTPDLAVFHNATNLRAAPDGHITADAADLIEIFPQTTAPLGKQEQSLPLLIEQAEGIHLRIRERGVTTAEIAKARTLFTKNLEASFLTNLNASIQESLLSLERSKHLLTTPLEIEELHHATLFLTNGIGLTLHNDTAITLLFSEKPATYHSFSPDNWLFADPEGLSPLQFYGATLSIVDGEALEHIKAGNKTTISFTQAGNLACAAFTPLSSFTFQPENPQRSLSFVTFSKPHTVCIKRPAETLSSCTSDCTLLDLKDSSITSNGILDLQAPLDPHPRSIYTSFGKNTAVLSFDKAFQAAKDVEILDQQPVNLHPTPWFSLSIQSGHQLITLQKAFSANGATRFFTIHSAGHEPLQVEDQFALQRSSSGNGVYLLSPTNPMIRQLIQLADARVDSP